ncbi:hypothetical protein F3Y22_tig00112416pilonHSYRG00063 [Hibiscus syriacus]|uniref:Uncharacterized protein n=1 Tax=Hibiscus syriacus TaxID=106335 RepID=A0A6A2Y4H2_HIBSY|nr:hypothetical protein F3Y22_tig00112416pilonHSYRG00063 [Hibiscus syriacus]
MGATEAITGRFREQIRELDNLQDCQRHGGRVWYQQQAMPEMEDAYEVAERIMSKCDMQPRS